MIGEAADCDVTDDALFGGSLRFRQPRRGHRIGTDTVLLAALAHALPGPRILDLGAGVGGLGVTLAKLRPEAAVVLVEREPSLAALAGENAAVNGVAGQVRVVAAAVERLRPDRLLDAGAADLVVCNPPFHDPGRHRASPDPVRHAAHIMTPATLREWLDTVAWALAPRGVLAMIYRADALALLLGALGSRFGDVAIRPVHPAAALPASRVLVTAALDSRAPSSILAGLVLHDESGGFTPLAAALHRGDFAAYPRTDRRGAAAGAQPSSLGVSQAQGRITTVPFGRTRTPGAM